jgi:metal-responsive CopG/Arc/MetJ family transcriptional regulator
MNNLIKVSIRLPENQVEFIDETLRWKLKKPSRAVVIEDIVKSVLSKLMKKNETKETK